MITLAESDRQINVLIGAIDLARAPYRLATVLGSCVGLTLYDPGLALAGMAHILLPDSRGAGVAPPGKYADRAVPTLISAILGKGAVRPRLRAKLAGGARMFSRVGPASGMDVGAHNVAAVHAALEQAGIPILAEDTGGSRGRKIIFDIAASALSVETLEATNAI